MADCRAIEPAVQLLTWPAEEVLTVLGALIPAVIIVVVGLDGMPPLVDALHQAIRWSSVRHTPSTRGACCARHVGRL